MTVLIADSLLAAREQMAFTLGFHIILAALGVAFPALMLIANYIGLRRKDPVALELAQRWSKVAAVTFAVGAVTGTVLAFEFGLLWPGFTERFGEVFGILFTIEGIFFFLEAIFLAIYIFGWKRLSGWKHFWTGVPVAICGIGGAFSVVAVNSWMNQPPWRRGSSRPDPPCSHSDRPSPLAASARRLDRSDGLPPCRRRVYYPDPAVPISRAAWPSASGTPPPSGFRSHEAQPAS